MDDAASARSYRTKREHAVAKVRGAIMDGRYRPGQPLRQVQLMADLDLGATPAREASLELVAKGLLVHESHHGIRVATLDAGRVAQVYRVRALLESEAARLAAASATPATIARVRDIMRTMAAAYAAGDLRATGEADARFHRTLYEGAGNPMLLALIEQMWDQFPRYMLRQRPARVRQSIAEHRAIAAAFARRDAPATARAVARHIHNGLAAFEAILADDERNGDPDGR
jgi:DNA-binding GntR family transcriptional regulator